MVKYVATGSGSKYLVGREGWKRMLMNMIMYGCGVLAWYQHECDDLEVRQNGMDRWLWDVGNVRNEQIRGETGWSTFEEREFGLLELVNLSCLREVSVNGMENHGMNVDGEGWKKYICERIQESGRRAWKDGFNDTEGEQEYVRMKESP